MSATDKAKDLLKTTALVVDSLHTIQALTRVGGDKAGAVLQLIDAIVSKLINGLSGKTTPEDVEKELRVLISKLADNDLKADLALHGRFDSSDEGK